MTPALRAHWPEYGIEAAGLATFMISACSFGVLIFHPDSPAYAALGTDLGRRLMGVAMGATAIGIIMPARAKRGCAKLDHRPDRPCIFCGQGRAVPHPTGAQLRLAH